MLPYLAFKVEQSFEEAKLQFQHHGYGKNVEAIIIRHICLYSTASPNIYDRSLKKTVFGRIFLRY